MRRPILSRPWPTANAASTRKPRQNCGNASRQRRLSSSSAPSSTYCGPWATAAATAKNEHVGRSGDGGIDGIIRQDALGLTNVYIQAKRYADTNKVGAPEMRNFIGALESNGANLGVFITTSSFLDSAETTAEQYRHGRIILIDGIALTSLMLTYGVAVHKAREFTLYEIDDDFFDEELA